MNYFRVRKGIFFGCALSVALVLAGWLWAYVVLGDLDAPIIIHFTNTSGIDRIGTFSELNEIAFLGMLMVLIDSIITFVLWDRNRALAIYSLIFGLVLALLIFISFAAIISVN